MTNTSEKVIVVEIINEKKKKLAHKRIVHYNGEFITAEFTVTDFTVPMAKLIKKYNSLNHKHKGSNNLYKIL